MTAHDRRLFIWLRDFMDNELGVVEHRPTIRRLEACKRMLQRWLADDADRRWKKAGGVDAEVDGEPRKE